MSTQPVPNSVKEAISMVAGVRVFVTSKEKIKHPEGTDLFDAAIKTLQDYALEGHHVAPVATSTVPCPTCLTPVENVPLGNLTIEKIDIAQVRTIIAKLRGRGYSSGEEVAKELEAAIARTERSVKEVEDERMDAVHWAELHRLRAERIEGRTGKTWQSIAVDLKLQLRAQSDRAAAEIDDEAVERALAAKIPGKDITAREYIIEGGIKYWSPNSYLWQNKDSKPHQIMRAALVAARTQQRAPVGAYTDLDDLRRDGWSVAVHNDYHLQGSFHTFWLFTKKGRSIKGEGTTDAEALKLARAQAAESDRLDDGWQRMTDAVSAKQMEHLGKHEGDVYHAMQSLGVKFGKPETRPFIQPIKTQE